MKANLQDLYVLDEAFDDGALRVKFAATNIDIARFSTGECPGSVQVIRQSGSKEFDLVGTTRPGVFLFSSRLQELLRAANVTGWRPCPVALQIEKPNDGLRNYAAIGITAHSGGLDNSRSIRSMARPTKSGKTLPMWVGIYFDEATWDGSDVFRPEGTMLTIVTLRVKELLEDAAVTNIRLRRILEVERMAL